MAPTADRARELLDYDQETGVFTRRICLSNRSKVGAITRCKQLNGYIGILVDGKRYYAHRLAWLIVHGQWPTDHIDHINGDTGDNRLANLREASRSLNLQNQRRPKSTNKSGFLGVSRKANKKYFAATIFVQGKQRHLGYFNDPAEAYQVYLEAKRHLHAGCTI